MGKLTAGPAVTMAFQMPRLAMKMRRESESATSIVFTASTPLTGCVVL